MSCSVIKDTYFDIYYIYICVNSGLSKETLYKFCSPSKEGCKDILKSHNIDRFVYYISGNCQPDVKIKLCYGSVYTDDDWWLQKEDLEIRQCKHCNYIYAISKSCQRHQDYYCCECNKKHLGMECIDEQD